MQSNLNEQPQQGNTVFSSVMQSLLLKTVVFSFNLFLIPF